MTAGDEFDALLNSDGFDQAVLAVEDKDAVFRGRHSTSDEQQRSRPLKRPAPDNKDDVKEYDSDEAYYEGDDGAFDVTGFGEGGKYLANKRKKLTKQIDALVRHEQRETGISFPQIFGGMAVYVNGLTPGIPLNSLYKMMRERGATIVQYLDRKSMVTHILAHELTPSKMIELREYKVAHPQWIIDSVEAGKLLNWRTYSVHAAHAQDDSLAYDDVAARRGAQVAGNNLFSMGIGRPQSPVKPPPKTEAPAPARRVVKVVPGGKAKAHDSETVTRSPTRPNNTETVESLAERGVRLAQAALNAQQQQKSAKGIANFFQPRRAVTTTTSSNATDEEQESPPEDPPSSPPTSPMKPTSPAKRKSDPDSHGPTTDFAGPATEQTRSYLPTRSKSARTRSLLDDADWMAKHTSASEDFLEGYFQQSRLHHISTWKEELKALVASLQPSASSLPARKKKLSGTAADGRTIFHVDFDCFFVSAGLTTRPHLKGKAVAVCHAKNSEDAASSTSEIASCSYEARAKGVKAGISLGRARELCPEIKTIPFEFDVYRSIASKFYSILLEHASVLQAVSVDEVLMEVKLPNDLASSSQDPALDFAQRLRDVIRQATDCEASIGIGHNILLARLASRQAKPANAFHLKPEQVADFVAPLSVDSLPGIGYSMRHRLEDDLGVKTVGDLVKIKHSDLARVLGEQNARKFAAFARGIDDRELEVGKARQSVSAEVNYGIRFEKVEEVERFVRALGVETAKRVKQERCLARQMTLKVMQRHPEAPVDTPKFLGHGWCNTFNQSSTIAGPGGKATDDGAVIGNVAWTLMKKLNIPPKELRGIGIQLSKLEREGQSVDAVREKGQSKLSFGAAAPQAPPPPAEDNRFPTVDDEVEDRMPSSDSVMVELDARNGARQSTSRLQQEPSVLVLSDSDGSSTPTSPPRKPVTRASTRAAENKKAGVRAESPYVPSMFQPRKRAAPPVPPTTSQVSDSELVHYGIDPDVFRSLPPDLRSDQLAVARKTKFAPARKMHDKKGQPRLQGQVSKPNLATEASIDRKGKGKALEADPSVLVISSSIEVCEDDAAETKLDRALPKTLTDDELEMLGWDKSVYRELSPEEQKQLATDHKRQLESIKSRTITNDRHKLGRRRVLKPRRANLPKIRLVKPLRFSGQESVECQREVIEHWIDEYRLTGPKARDLDKFATFLEKVVTETSKGRDLDRVKGLLDWWKYLIETEFGRLGKEQAEAGKVWWDAHARTKERVVSAVLRIYNSTLNVL
ncbi:deoxycytidyl transferase [Microbotryomycetes sp. JL201]|nr:deoxycytidyl transferase [Microbotryomycetes sp. JL201]